MMHVCNVSNAMTCASASSHLALILILIIQLHILISATSTEFVCIETLN